MATADQLPVLYLAQARACRSVQDCMSIYDNWAATYNNELSDKDQEYVAPTIVAQLVLQRTNDLSRHVILDAGCGTGLVGQALALVGARTIDGLDLSPAMLNVAKQTGVYRTLSQADMTQKVPQGDGIYDIVTCVVTFTSGHVGPDPALRELVRLTKTNGTIIATILEEFWESAKFSVEIEKLVAEKLVTVLAKELIDYVKGHGEAVVVVLQKVI